MKHLSSPNGRLTMPSQLGRQCTSVQLIQVRGGGGNIKGEFGETSWLAMGGGGKVNVSFSLNHGLRKLRAFLILKGSETTKNPTHFTNFSWPSTPPYFLRLELVPLVVFNSRSAHLAHTSPLSSALFASSSRSTRMYPASLVNKSGSSFVKYVLLLKYLSMYAV